MNTDCNLSQRLILALIADAVDLDSPSEGWACHVLAPDATTSLRSHTSFLTLLAHKPSRLGIPEPQRSTLPTHQKKNVAVRARPEIPGKVQPADPPPPDCTAII